MAPTILSIPTSRIALVLFLLLNSATLKAQVISTVAGSATAGYSGDGSSATAATLDNPVTAIVDGSGNLYITDYNNHVVRKVNTSGVITTIAGNHTSGSGGDGGQATAAQLNSPLGLALDGSGNLFISDQQNNNIRKVNASSIISTIAGNGSRGYGGDGGAATASILDWPKELAVDAGGNLYIADWSNLRIRKINTSGVISAVAGNGTAGFSGDGGPATAAELNFANGIALDGAGNLFIADSRNNRIRKVNASGIISTIAGTGTSGYTGDGGPATAATFNNPYGVYADASANVYIADGQTNCVRKINASGIISTIAGNGTAGFSGDGGPATAAKLDIPSSVTMDGAGNIYIADENNNRVRKITACTLPAPGAITGIDSVCPGRTIVLTDTPSGGTWSSTNTSIATVNGTGTVYGVAPGLDTIKYTVTNGCGSNSAVFPIRVRTLASCNTSVEDVAITGHSFVSVFPNPTHGTFSVTLAREPIETVQLNITNVLGKKVGAFVLSKARETTIKLDAPAGIYFLSMVVDGEVYYEKIVIE